MNAFHRGMAAAQTCAGDICACNKLIEEDRDYASRGIVALAKRALQTPHPPFVGDELVVDVLADEVAVALLQPGAGIWLVTLGHPRLEDLIGTLVSQCLVRCGVV